MSMENRLFSQFSRLGHMPGSSGVIMAAAGSIMYAVLPSIPMYLSRGHFQHTWITVNTGRRPFDSFVPGMPQNVSSAVMNFFWKSLDELHVDIQVVITTLFWCSCY
eukprot:FR735738.1.p2 GENE.FR735738.1~~FR735738.1.p2  ORF type:complete len:106 (-),score=4.47 FR735738.1:215-532(-)